jgi:hypothetical protein
MFNARLPTRVLLNWSPDNDADDPVQITSDRTPLTGNIGSSSSRPPVSQSYLTSSIPGEDRRAPQNTIDESVWQTVSRDLLAVWAKMKQVLWPKYLLGGVLQRGGGMGAAERGEMEGFGRGIGGLVGRWPDADGILQGGMSEGLRDWDLWYVARSPSYGNADQPQGVPWCSVSSLACSSPWGHQGPKEISSSRAFSQSCGSEKR